MRQHYQGLKWCRSFRHLVPLQLFSPPYVDWYLTPPEAATQMLARCEAREPRSGSCEVRGWHSRLACWLAWRDTVFAKCETGSLFGTACEIFNWNLTQIFSPAAGSYLRPFFRKQKFSVFFSPAAGPQFLLCFRKSCKPTLLCNCIKISSGNFFAFAGANPSQQHRSYLEWNPSFWKGIAPM